MMLKSRTLFFIAIGLLLLGVAFFTFFTRDQEPTQYFPATVNRDCAPWDGSAFTVRIPLDHGDTIDISIWQSPDIKFAKTFSFPDDSGQVGNVSYRFASGDFEQLNGSVYFANVEVGNPVEGTFDLRSANGNQFKGNFKAEWGNEIMLCG